MASEQAAAMQRWKEARGKWADDVASIKGPVADLLAAGDAMAASLNPKTVRQHTRPSYEGVPGVRVKCVVTQAAIIVTLYGDSQSDGRLDVTIDRDAVVEHVEGEHEMPIAFSTKWTPGR